MTESSMQTENPIRRSPKLIDLTGRIFGRLTVVRYVGNCKWECLCLCGNITSTLSRELKRGNSKSCGCLCSERTREANTTHGMKGTRTYRIWAGMLTRCRNKNDPSFADYGAKGIRVCEQWYSFENFLADMGEAPSGFSIERKDNKLGYCKENCTWIPLGDQAKNRSSSVVIEIDGVKMVAADWDRENGFYPGTVAKRLKNGWDIKDLLRPINKNLSRTQKSKHVPIFRQELLERDEKKEQK
jgi:hypothetical protein